MTKKIYIYTFYRFKTLINVKTIREKLYIVSKDRFIFGTILIANEGINGTISGTKSDLENLIVYLKKLLKIRKLSLKISENQFIPFYRLKIRLKKEIVTIGDKSIKPEKLSGKLIPPNKWDSIINDKKFMVIDTRNNYETDIGTFKNSISLRTNSFREFPKYIRDQNLSKNQPIAMFCTGGIRCEKASSYLLKNGYKNVCQLDGGILNYLEFKKNKKKSSWVGECFVFDNRVSINKNLKKGKYDQCYGCRNPITYQDKKSALFVKGVTCPKCYHYKTSESKKRSLSRQNQIENAELNRKPHNFKNKYLKDL